jgi:hypothetical protein
MKSRRNAAYEHCTSQCWRPKRILVRLPRPPRLKWLRHPDQYPRSACATLLALGSGPLPKIPLAEAHMHRRRPVLPRSADRWPHAFICTHAGRKTTLTWSYRESKVRETTCGYAKGVDGQHGKLPYFSALRGPPRRLVARCGQPSGSVGSITAHTTLPSRPGWLPQTRDSLDTTPSPERA